MAIDNLSVFVINLDGSTSRLAQATAALKAIGLPFTRLAAFDGRGRRPDDLPLYDARSTRGPFGRRLSGGEIGCFLSHRKAAQLFLDGGKPLGLVLEDDLGIAVGAAAALSAMVSQVIDQTDWHVANLGSVSRQFTSPVATLAPHFTLMRAHYFPVTTTALLWNRAGAAAFLRDSQIIRLPVDHFLRVWATSSDKGLAVARPLFPAVNLPSEIDAAESRRKTGRGIAYPLTRQKMLLQAKWRAWWSQRRWLSAQCKADQ